MPLYFCRSLSANFWLMSSRTLAESHAGVTGTLKTSADLKPVVDYLLACVITSTVYMLHVYIHTLCFGLNTL